MDSKQGQNEPYSYLMNTNQPQTVTNCAHFPSEETHSHDEQTQQYYDRYAQYNTGPATLSSSSLSNTSSLSLSSKNETAQTQTSETNNETKQCDTKSITHSDLTTETEGEQTPNTAASEQQHDDLLIFLDWDDTLYPTTMMNNILQRRDKNDLAMVRDEEIGIFRELGAHTLELLSDLIAKYGANNVHIVSNSLSGWIRESLSYAACISTVYKEIERILIENDITICSAQSMFASKTNRNPTSWKAMCFEQILNGNKTKSCYAHILSIGDQWTDHYAVKQSINTLSTSPIHHVIKLKISPNLHDMMNEILYIKTCFEQIFNVISCKKTPFYAAPQSVRPVVIDYHHEEMKYYSKLNCCSNVNVNLNVNVNVNVNVVNK